MNVQEIRAYEAMAKLDPPGAERDWALKQAAMLEESFNALPNIPTDGVEPLVSVLPLKNVLREDVAVRMLPREEILANAPEQYDGYFQVPKTLE